MATNLYTHIHLSDRFPLQEAEDQKRFMAHFGTLARQFAKQSASLLRVASMGAAQPALMFAQHNCAAVCLQIALGARRGVVRQHRADQSAVSKVS